MPRWIAIYLVPGAVLQSVMVGGGYGTGREAVEFFTCFGAGGGLLGTAVATLCVAVVFALSLELARSHHAYDYRSFFKVLLGRWWVAYEVLLVALIMLVLAVLGAAAGDALESQFGIDARFGTVLMLVAVTTLTFFGRDVVTALLTWWSVALYLVFGSYLVAVLLDAGEVVTARLAIFETKDGWFVSSLQYVFYNVTAVPLVLFAARAIETRRQAFGAGVIGAVIAVLPAVALHVSFVAGLPEIIDASLPVQRMLDGLGIELLTLAYLLILVGTCVETGIGDLQGVIERLDARWIERTGRALRPAIHGVVAAGAMLTAGALSLVGVVTLIADGYGTLSWGFLLTYVLPLLTIGVWRIFTGARDDGVDARSPDEVAVSG